MTTAGTIRGRDFSLPNLLWARGMHGKFGFMKDRLELYPVVNLDPDMENVIRRRIMRSTQQAA